MEPPPKRLKIISGAHFNLEDQRVEPIELKDVIAIPQQILFELFHYFNYPESSSRTRYLNCLIIIIYFSIPKKHFLCPPSVCREWKNMLSSPLLTKYAAFTLAGNQQAFPHLQLKSSMHLQSIRSTVNTVLFYDENKEMISAPALTMERVRNNTTTIKAALAVLWPEDLKIFPSYLLIGNADISIKSFITLPFHQTWTVKVLNVRVPGLDDVLHGNIKFRCITMTKITQCEDVTQSIRSFSDSQHIFRTRPQYQDLVKKYKIAISTEQMDTLATRMDNTENDNVFKILLA